MFHIFVLLLLLFEVNSDNECGSNFICSANSSALYPFCLPKDYKKDIRPDTADNPLDIFLHLDIKDIIRVNDYDTTISLKLTLSIGWKENRLKILPQSQDWIVEEDEYDWTKLNPNWLQCLWIPDVEIVNMKELKTTSVFNKLSSLELYENKQLWYDFPVELTLTCPWFTFEKYPLDNQACEIMIGSYQYDEGEMHYSGVVSYERQKQRPLQYRVKDVKQLQPDKSIFAAKEYWLSKNGTMTGKLYNYSRLVAHIELERSIQTHVMETYLPSSLFVVSSWIGFVIDPDAVPGRIALSVMLLLVLTQISTQLDETSPKSEGMNAIQVWIICCTVMVFMALLEYGLILWMRFDSWTNIFTKRNGKSPEKSKLNQNQQSSATSLSVIKNKRALDKDEACPKMIYNIHQNKDIERERYREKLFDKISIIVFPTTFFVFNIWYWMTFL